MADRFDKFSEHARLALTLAQEEAQRLNHDYIVTEHLLLALGRQPMSIAARTLTALGATPDKVRGEIEAAVTRGSQPVLGEIGLMPDARKTIELAVDEARRFNHHYIGTEHLLLGLARERDGHGARALHSLGLTYERMREEITRLLAELPPRPSDAPRSWAIRHTRTNRQIDFTTGFGLAMALTTEARAIIEAAIEQAKSLGHERLRADHLLLALMQPDAPTAAVFAEAGADMSALREAVAAVSGVFGELADVRRKKDEAIAAQRYEEAARLRARELDLQVQINELDLD
jgi:ATP-dependent Clp protease ATP-binding subunit ClpA